MSDNDLIRELDEIQAMSSIDWQLANSWAVASRLIVKIDSTTDFALLVGINDQGQAKLLVDQRRFSKVLPVGVLRRTGMSYEGEL